MSKEMIELADWLRHMRAIHETSICYQDPAIVEIIEKLRSWEDKVRASLPAPEAAPTREEIAKAAFNLAEAVECSVDLDLHPLLKKRVDATKSALKAAPAK